MTEKNAHIINGIIHLKLAKSLARNPSSDSSEVEKNFSLAIKNGARNDEVFIAWAEYLKSQKKITQAIELLESGCETAVNKGQINLELGNLYSSLNDQETALKKYKIADEQLPENVVIKNNLGITHFSLRDLQN
jgi:tetratricopeptide (TPR) repeat protein